MVHALMATHADRDVCIDIVENVIQTDGGWWEGDLAGKHGVFPGTCSDALGDHASLFLVVMLHIGIVFIFCIIITENFVEVIATPPAAKKAAPAKPAPPKTGPSKVSENMIMHALRLCVVVLIHAYLSIVEEGQVHIRLRC